MTTCRKSTVSSRTSACRSWMASNCAVWRRRRPEFLEIHDMTHDISRLQPRHQPHSVEDGGDVERPLVLIVDDDEGVRTALRELILSVGLDATCFASTRELLDAELPPRPGCLILDVRMPGSSGLDLQEHLASSAKAKPIIFLTGHGDIPMTVKAMKAGAVDFLTKPVRDQTLLDAVSVGIEKDIEQRASARVVRQNAERLATLTPRERPVMRVGGHGR